MKSPKINENAPAERPTELIRTDLACERCPAADADTRTVDVGGQPVTLARQRGEDGYFVTLSTGRLTGRGEGDLLPLAELLADELRGMATDMLGRSPDSTLRVLVAGLGNPDMTPDAVGPGTVRRMTVTRHLRACNGELYAALGCCDLSAVAPGVLGQTGIESAELVRAAAGLVRPHLVVAVDALAARDCGRLSSTVQLTDRGISPGSGIGNRRAAINEEFLGCPVMGVGVPTVVDSATLVKDALERAGMGEGDIPVGLKEVLERGRSFIVAPKDCDSAVEMSCRLLARGLDLAFGVGEI
jgi:spore protease